MGTKRKNLFLGTGKKRDFKAEEEMTEAERLRKEEEVKNYKVWNKGKKQLEKREENVSFKVVKFQ